MLVFDENLPGAFLQYPKFDHLVNHVCQESFLNSNGENFLEVCKTKSKGIWVR